MAICRVSKVLRSPSPDPKRSAPNCMLPICPLFTEDTDDQWHEISTIGDVCPDLELVSLIKGEQSRIEAAAIRVLRELTRASIPDDASECVSGHLVCFLNNPDRGFYSYLEFHFPHDDCSSDLWWAFAACPQPYHKAFTPPNRPSFNVWRVGWECAR